jgi:hypothetical protein
MELAINERIFREDGHQRIRGRRPMERRLIAGVWSKDVLIRRKDMKRMMLMVAAVLIASAAVGYAQQKGGNAGGASNVSPGDQLKDKGGPTPGSRGASELSPGD